MRLTKTVAKATEEQGKEVYCRGSDDFQGYCGDNCFYEAGGSI